MTFLVWSIIFQVCVAINDHHTTFHFNSYHFTWNNHNAWKWNSSHENSTNITIACSKQFPSLCIHTQTQSLSSLKISYKPHQRNIITFDFWNDSDWSQVEILHKTSSTQNKRQLLNKHDTAINDGIFGNIAHALGNKVGIYGRPPCDESSSQCRVHLYHKVNFERRANQKGFFCEGNWDQSELLKYGVNRRSISSVQIQGSPCCVMVAYNGLQFDGDMQAMYPRGAYPSMTMGIDTAMGLGVGAASANGMALMHGMSPAFANNRMESMRVVHDCALRQRLMPGAAGGGAIYGNNMNMMNNDYMPNMEQLLGSMMMMKMMLPLIEKHHHHHHHNHCKYYQCIVDTQQKQLQYLMQMMNADSSYNHASAPITISERRRIMYMTQELELDVIGIKKCKLLYGIEICVVFDAIQNVIELIYTVMKHENDIIYNKDEDIQTSHHSALFVYGMIRNEIMFTDDIDMNITAYFDTFILESNSKHQCSDIDVAYSSYAICVLNTGVIYFDKRMENDLEERLMLIDDELKDVKLDVMNESDWSEIYHGANRKICAYVSIIKICVELQHADAATFKILIEY